MQKLLYFTDAELLLRNAVYEEVYPLGDEVRAFQEEALLSAAVRGRHTLVVAPTGIGKSRIIPLVVLWSMVKDPMSMGIVLSPLKNLEELLTQDLRAMCPRLNATHFDTKGDQIAQREAWRRGAHRVMCVPPELGENVNGWFAKLLRTPLFTRHLRYVIVDEVHLLEKWKDFRRGYDKLCSLYCGPNTIFVLLTCTLTSSVRKYVFKEVGLMASTVHSIRVSTIKDKTFLAVRVRPGAGDTVYRHEIYYLDPIIEMVRAYSRHGTPMERLLILCKSADLLNMIMKYFQDSLGLDMYHNHDDHYHNAYVQRVFAASDDRVKAYAFERFVKNLPGDGGVQIKAALLTSLGEVGHHYIELYGLLVLGAPGDILQARQQIGRPGRDGQPSWCCWYVNGTDKYDKDVEKLIKTTGCRHIQLYAPFGDKFTSTGQCCDNCIAASHLSPIASNVYAEVGPPGRAPELESPDDTMVQCVTRGLRRIDFGDSEEADFSPFLLLRKRFARLATAGLSAVRCDEYVAAFSAGSNMNNYTYAHQNHKELVLACIAICYDDVMAFEPMMEIVIDMPNIESI
jgi:hypothetical protein